jgi:hypothetical protein
MSDRDWNGCTLINPLCPDDLCILPPHKGNHCLMTMIESGLVSPLMHRVKGHRTYEELVQLGFQEAIKLIKKGVIK